MKGFGAWGRGVKVQQRIDSKVSKELGMAKEKGFELVVSGF